MKTNQRAITFFLLAISLLSLSCSLSGKAASTSTPIHPISIPGWEKFSGAGIELWMPASFEGGDLANDLDVILKQLRALGPEYQKVADMIEQNPESFVLLVYDSKIGATGFLTNVNVTRQQVLSGMKLDAYLDANSSQLGTLGFTVLEQKIVQLDNYEAGRLVIQSDALKAKEVMYIIKVKNTMWITTYTTGISEFSSRLPVFEQSANTIKITP